LTGNIQNYSLEIQKNDIVLDGCGFSMSLPTGVDYSFSPINIKICEPLIDIAYSNNVVITNLNVHHFVKAIKVSNCSNIIVTKCNLTEGRTAIYAAQNNNCRIIGNQLNNTETGISASDSNNLSIAYNNITNNKFTGIVISGLNNSQFMFNNVQNNNYSEYTRGITFQEHNFNNRFFENNFIDNRISIDCGNIARVYNNTIINNFWSNNQINVVYKSTEGLSGIDQEPLSKKAETTFDAYQFSITNKSSEIINRLVIAITTIAFFVCLIVLWYFRKTRK